MPDCPSPSARPADAAAIPDPAGKTRTPCITEKAGEASSASAPQSTFMAWLVRMSLIRRWALMLCIRPENVSEHSHQTAVIAHLLAVIRNRLFGGHLNPERIATLALYHEVSETKLQDLNSRTKYHDPEFTRQYKKLEAIAERECLNTLPPELRDEFRPLIMHEHIDPECQQVVKAADVLAAYLKACDELRFSNLEFTHVKQGLEPRLQHLCETLPEVRYFVNTFVKCCWATVDQLTGLDQDTPQKDGTASTRAAAAEQAAVPAHLIEHGGQ